MAMRLDINWGVLSVFGVLIAGCIVAGFLAPVEAQADNGSFLDNPFFRMGGMLFMSMGGLVLWATLSNRRRAVRERTWLDAPARIIEVSETGTTVNNQPRIRLRLRVQSPVHPVCEVIHKQVVPLTALALYSAGATIMVKVNPDDPKDIMLT
ncbi:MAG: DUF3592 domain-containing protein [Candidatus Fermentibacteraceae bacterium]|nr:DUF3592 domain-containing protein [Candidatus Fermentibacteraceae bacterium]MBN2608554.1 DUF3592 domain-containing protein [Candidatus Fermentibacteraceae bacterium]